MISKSERKKIEDDNLEYRRALHRPLHEAIHQAMESVRFTGRIEFRDGKWVGIYGESA